MYGVMEGQEDLSESDSEGEENEFAKISSAYTEVDLPLRPELDPKTQRTALETSFARGTTEHPGGCYVGDKEELSVKEHQIFPEDTGFDRSCITEIDDEEENDPNEEVRKKDHLSANSSLVELKVLWKGRTEGVPATGGTESIIKYRVSIALKGHPLRFFYVSEEILPSSVSIPQSNQEVRLALACPYDVRNSSKKAKFTTPFPLSEGRYRLRVWIGVNSFNAKYWKEIGKSDVIEVKPAVVQIKLLSTMDSEGGVEIRVS